MKRNTLALFFVLFTYICVLNADTASPSTTTTQATTTQTATTTGTSVAELAKLAQNPVSGLREIGLDMSLSPDMPITGGTEGSYTTQIVWPFAINEEWRLISYTILPVLQVPEGNGNEKVGMGNTLLNFYVTPTKPTGKLLWGAGPAVLLPTRSDPLLGSDQVGLGPSALVYYMEEKWGAGIVLQNIWSLGGEGENEVNAFDAQYFLNYNLPQGYFLYSNASAFADWLTPSDERWTVPIGGGVGKYFNIKKQSLSASMQALYNVVRPSDTADWTLNFQFAIMFP